MDIAISIIVPVYNLEEYLHKCVNSILSQTFIDFELILVNDGSTDNSGDICDEYANTDKRVKVIHKENGGVASSRNAGLDVANGEYIGFVDNDDFINKYMFEILYENMTTYSSDIVVCDYQSIYEDNEPKPVEHHSNYHIENFTGREALNRLYLPGADTLIVPWNKLYKKKLFADIRYEVGILCDDETVVHKLLYECQNVTYIHLGLYYYLQRANSSVNAPFSIRKFDQVHALKNRETFFRNKNEFALQQKALKAYIGIFFRNYNLAKTRLNDVEKELKELKRTFDKSLPHILRHKGIGIKQKAMFILFSLSPALFEMVRDNREKRYKNRQSKV